MRGRGSDGYRRPSYIACESSQEEKHRQNRLERDDLEPGRASGRILAHSAEQDANILNRGDQVILDLLSP